MFTYKIEDLKDTNYVSPEIQDLNKAANDYLKNANYAQKNQKILSLYKAAEQSKNIIKKTTQKINYYFEKENKFDDDVKTYFTIESNILNNTLEQMTESFDKYKSWEITSEQVKNDFRRYASNIVHAMKDYIPIVKDIHLCLKNINSYRNLESKEHEKFLKIENIV